MGQGDSGPHSFGTRGHATGLRFSTKRNELTNAATDKHASAHPDTNEYPDTNEHSDTDEHSHVGTNPDPYVDEHAGTGQYTHKAPANAYPKADRCSSCQKEYPLAHANILYLLWCALTNGWALNPYELLCDSCCRQSDNPDRIVRTMTTPPDEEARQ